jgi:hypothetical protein
MLEEKSHPALLPWSMELMKTKYIKFRAGSVLHLPGSGLLALISRILTRTTNGSELEQQISLAPRNWLVLPQYQRGSGMLAAVARLHFSPEIQYAATQLTKMSSTSSSPTS